MRIMQKLKKIAAAFIAVITMSLSATTAFAETTDNGLTREEAAAYAYELLQILDYSTQFEAFDGDADGTWYALYEYLTEAIYNDPMLFADLYAEWQASTDEYSGLYDSAVITTMTGDTNIENPVTYKTTKGVGVITIKAFYEDTGAEFAKAYEKARKAGVKSVIIDLRDNLGGIVDAAYECLNAIYTEKIPLYYGKMKDFVSIATSDGLGTWKPDLTVLVDENTGSASEMMAACLSDSGYARVIGTKTYGKGIAQYYLSLSSGNVLGITAMRFFLPNGQTWDKRGITPDIEIKDDPETAEDEVLAKAIETADGEGIELIEEDAFNFIIKLDSDIQPEDLDTFASIKRMGDAFPKPVRFTYVSDNNMRMIVDSYEAFEAAGLEYYFGIDSEMSAAVKAALNNAGLEDIEVIYTVANDEFGFSPTVALDTKIEGEYFYYFNGETGELTAFDPVKSYGSGVLRFAIEKGGIILISDYELE